MGPGTAPFPGRAAARLGAGRRGRVRPGPGGCAGGWDVGGAGAGIRLFLPVSLHKSLVYLVWLETLRRGDSLPCGGGCLIRLGVEFRVYVFIGGGLADLRTPCHLPLPWAAHQAASPKGEGSRHPACRGGPKQPWAGVPDVAAL